MSGHLQTQHRGGRRPPSALRRSGSGGPPRRDGDFEWKSDATGFAASYHAGPRMGALEKAYKPDSVPPEWNTQPGMIISLGCELPRISSSLPEDLGWASLAAAINAVVPLFGLAPCGVLPATRVATRAVRSYRTFSPLLAFARPPFHAGFGGASPVRHRTSGPVAPKSAWTKAGGRRRAVYFLCHFPSGYPDRALPGALPCGVRTFLPSTRRLAAPRSGRSSGLLRRSSIVPRRPRSVNGPGVSGAR